MSQRWSELIAPAQAKAGPHRLDVSVKEQPLGDGAMIVTVCTECGRSMNHTFPRIFFESWHRDPRSMEAIWKGLMRKWEQAPCLTTERAAVAEWLTWQLQDGKPVFAKALLQKAEEANLDPLTVEEMGRRLGFSLAEGHWQLPADHPWRHDAIQE